MNTKEIIEKEIHGFKAKDVLESLLLPIRIYDPKKVPNIENIELNNEAPTLMDKFAKQLSEKLDRKPSIFYKMVCKSPIPYRIVPQSIRDRILRMKISKQNFDYVNKFSLEKIRQKFLETIGFNLKNKVNDSICIITHDIDTQKGLERSIRLKEIEEKYEVESTWFLLTEEYELKKKIVKRLAENGEIALHGDKHQLTLYNEKKDKIIKRLKKSKEKLETITEKEVIGFRAPLLQYNKKILEAVYETGFKYDSSTTSYEPINPLTMKPDGIELANPIIINGTIEQPVTLPQDHQMLHVLKITPEQTVKKWIELTNILKEQCLSITILVHPDYELASEDNITYYEQLIKKIGNIQPLGKLANKL
ncbi:MAG: polysaccharide deacetylase family protein [Nitrososphaeria archaeon]